MVPVKAHIDGFNESLQETGLGKVQIHLGLTLA